MEASYAQDEHRAGTDTDCRRHKGQALRRLQDTRAWLLVQVCEHPEQKSRAGGRSGDKAALFVASRCQACFRAEPAKPRDARGASVNSYASPSAVNARPYIWWMTACL